MTFCALRIRCIRRRGKHDVGLAAVLLVLSVAALVLCCKLVRKKAVRVVLIVLLSVVVLALAAYMGLTLIFVDAVQNQPPNA